MVKSNTYRFTLCILILCSNCDSEGLSDSNDPTPPDKYDSRFAPELTKELFAFVAIYGSDSSKVGIAPISNPGSFEFIDKHESIDAPRFNPSKNRLAYSVSKYYSQAGYLVEHDSTYRFPLSDRGLSSAISWINEAEYVHSRLISDINSFIRNTEHLNSSFLSHDMQTIGATLLPEGMLVWDNSDFRNGGLTFFGVYNFESGKTHKKDWLTGDIYQFTTASAADYEPESNKLVAEVIHSTTKEWALKVVDIGTGTTNVFTESFGYKFANPRWISPNRVLYMRVPQTGTFLGSEIRILDIRNGFTYMLLSVTSVQGASSLAFPDY